MFKIDNFNYLTLFWLNRHSFVTFLEKAEKIPLLLMKFIGFLQKLGTTRAETIVGSWHEGQCALL